MGFIYIWRDKLRGMYYVGSHEGTLDDGYVSSSRWLNFEQSYRPQDFRRKIIKFVDAVDLKAEEYRLLNTIKSSEFGRRYYNLRPGRQKGSTPWNKGKTDVYSTERIQQISRDRKARDPWNKGGSNPQAALNGRKGAAKQSATVRGRFRVYREDGSWTWGYPE